MNREDIIRMAREARFAEGMYWGNEVWEAKTGNLERFAALAAEWGAKQEREACAKVCEEVLWPDSGRWAVDFAAAIRSRGEVKP